MGEHSRRRQGGFAPLASLAPWLLALGAAASSSSRTSALVLLIAGAALIISESFVTSGLLGAMGVLLFTLGGVFLVDSLDPDGFLVRTLHVSWLWVVVIGLVLGGALGYVVYRSAQTRRLPQRGGDAGLVGEQGKALAPITPEQGEVFVHGERWRAASPAPIRAGAPVVVRRVKGLTLFVDEVKT